MSLKNAITVGELIANLSALPLDMPVVLSAGALEPNLHRRGDRRYPYREMTVHGLEKGFQVRVVPHHAEVSCVWPHDLWDKPTTDVAVLFSKSAALDPITWPK